MEEEEKVVKGDDVIVELDASLEDLYMGGSLKVISSEVLFGSRIEFITCFCFYHILLLSMHGLSRSLLFQIGNVTY